MPWRIGRGHVIDLEWIAFEQHIYSGVFFFLFFAFILQFYEGM